MTELFKALSDETRLRMVGLLISGERCVCEIETCLGLTQSNASRHLNVLRSAGILTSEKHAQWAYYHISEKFCTEHADLYSYLQTNFAAQEPYLSDGKRAALTEKHETC